MKLSDVLVAGYLLGALSGITATALYFAPEEPVPPLRPARTSAPEPPPPPLVLAKAFYECRLTFSEEEVLRIEEECEAEGGYATDYAHKVNCNDYGDGGEWPRKPLWTRTAYELDAEFVSLEGYTVGVTGWWAIPAYAGRPRCEP